MQAARVSVDMAESKYRQVKSSEWFPTFNLEGKYTTKDDVEGTQGDAHERLIKIEMSHSFNLGLSNMHNTRVEKLVVDEVQKRADVQQREVDTSARNAWSRLKTAKESRSYLQNQARIAGEFLKLARKERELGRRTLLDVLSGETALINANSDAAAAETDVLIAGFGVLHAMGMLSADMAIPSHDVAKTSVFQPSPV
jgi:outer membrane protein TolC